MTVTIELTPELEAKVLYAAKRTGLPVQEALQQAIEQMPAPPTPLPEEAVEDDRPTLWERSREVLEAIWASQPDDPITNYSELEEACDVPEARQI